MRLTAGALVGLLVLCGSGGTRADTPASAYHVIKKLPVGGDGGWDYLTMDPEAHRLYITRFNRVMVVDVETGSVVGVIPDTPGVHGVALVPKRSRGFTSNGQNGTVTVFDLRTLRQVGHIKVGTRPDAILYDEASDRVFTLNAGSKDATAIDATTEKVVGSVPLGGKPEAGVADGKGQVYVNVEDKNEIVAFDSKELKELHRWPVAPGTEPAGLSMDREGRRLFSTCHNQKMVVLDADSGKVIATPAIGRGTDACVYDPGVGLAFSSNGDGTLTAIQKEGEEYRVAANIPTERGARTMALDTKTHSIYLATARAKQIPPAVGGRRQRPTFEPGSFVIVVVGK
jgi:YVTN family beta-propeller protein